VILPPEQYAYCFAAIKDGEFNEGLNKLFKSHPQDFAVRQELWSSGAPSQGASSALCCPSGTGWELPLDTGDRTRTRVLTLPYYIAEIRATPDSLPVNISSSSTSINILPTIGGRQFRRCAWEQERCGCFGDVQFGASGVWSPPVEVNGDVLCAAGALFPDVLPAVQKECQCNSGDQILKVGMYLAGRILAVNSVGLGNFSAPAKARMMGNPSPVREPSTVKTRTTLFSRGWHPLTPALATQTLPFCTTMFIYPTATTFRRFLSHATTLSFVSTTRRQHAMRERDRLPPIVQPLLTRQPTSMKAEYTT